MSDSPSPVQGASQDDSRGSNAPSWYGEPVDVESDELVGTILSSTYEIVRVLGEGAMGRVYEAHHTRIPIKRFAIKILHPEFRRHPEALKRFQREAEAAATISHNNVVGVYDVDVASDGRPFIVCEYLEGIELGAYLHEVKRLDVPRAVRIIHQICDGLSEAHACGVVHRDVKPENVYLVGERERPTAKVLDFGLSRVEGPEASLTKAGTVMGTPSYMPPEQARGTRVDERADVYGVGAILYRAVTGRRPFEKTDVTATLAAVLTEEPPRPRSIEPSIPAGLEAVIQRAMAKNPDDRFSSPDELAAALEAYESSEGEPMPERRPRMATSDSIEVLPLQARYARPALLVIGALALFWLLGVTLSAAASALVLLSGEGIDRTPSGLELLLLSLAITGAVLTPVILGCVHVRRTIWQDTNRVVKLRDALRSVVLASMGAYAVAALLVRLHDGVVGTLVPGGLARGPSGVGWTAWNLVFFAMTALAGAAVGLSRRWLAGAGRSPSRTRQIIVGPVLATASIVLGGGLLYGGLIWRMGTAPPVVLAAVAEPAPEAEPPPAPEPPPPPATASPTAAPEPPVKKAPAKELVAASKSGPRALEALAARYPGDRAVMRAVVAAHAKDEAGWLAALEWSGKLLAENPEEASWQALRMLALRAAQADEPVATRAFELLSTKMGHHGPDLLFDLMLAGEHAARERARRALGREEVYALATPAVRVAYDLKKAESCEEALALLDRAREEGDSRTVAVLSLLSDGSKKGCGADGRRPCAAKCQGDDKQPLRDVITAIRKRG